MRTAPSAAATTPPIRLQQLGVPGLLLLASLPALLLFLLLSHATHAAPTWQPGERLLASNAAHLLRDSPSVQQWQRLGATAQAHAAAQLAALQLTSSDHIGFTKGGSIFVVDVLPPVPLSEEDEADDTEEDARRRRAVPKLPEPERVESNGERRAAREVHATASARLVAPSEGWGQKKNPRHHCGATRACSPAFGFHL